MGFPPFKQYTTCIDAVYFNKSSQNVQATIVATGVVAPLAVISALTAPWCLFMLIPIFAAAWMIGYCYWFLHQRLICLPSPPASTVPGGSDQLTIGMVVDLLPPYLNTFPTSIDTDYSFGLLVAPNQPGEPDMSIVENSVPYGFLIAEQPATHNIAVPFTGNTGTDQQTGATSWILHCEFEGAGVYDLLLASSIALAVGIAALMVCMFVPFPLGLILAIILAILSLLTVAVGAGVAAGDEASPADENPALGADLHPGDLLVVAGAWIYDSGHNHDSPPRGYNEIHPIKFCSPIGHWDGDWPANLNDLEIFWATALGDATSTTTIELQKQPQNQWQVHPILDGCQPAVIV
jgi:hypothetical protein